MNRSTSGLIWAGIGFVLVSFLWFNVISRQTSSTVGIAIFLIPITAAPYTIPFFLFGYCVVDLSKVIKERFKSSSTDVKVRSFIAFALAMVGLGYVGCGIAFTMVVNGVRRMSDEELNNFLDRSLMKKNKFALGALAENPNASTETLDRVAKSPDPELDDRMFSIWPVLGENVNGRAVMRLIAVHKNVSEETLAHLAKSSDDFVRCSVAANPKTPVMILRKLAIDPGYATIGCLASNEMTPPDLLAKLASNKSEYTRIDIARNLNTSTDTLAELAKDSRWLVRREVAENPNTPTNVIAELIKDPDENVRDEARKMRKTQLLNSKGSKPGVTSKQPQ
jgi:hypothetical protein